MVRVCYCDRASDGEPHDSEASMSQKRTNQPNSTPMSAGEDPPTDALAVPAGNMLGRTEAARAIGVSKPPFRRRREGSLLPAAVGPHGVAPIREDHVREHILQR